MPRAALSVRTETAPSKAQLQAWDELVRSCPGSDVAQLSAWARVRALAGFSAAYVFAEEGSHLVGGAQLLVRRLPGLGTVGYVPYGPVAADAASPPAEVQASLAAALDQACREHLRTLFVQPPDGGAPVSTALLRRGFRTSDANVAPRATLRIDLTVDEDQLRRNLSRRLRGWTRQWEARGLIVREGRAEDLPLAAELHALTGEHQGFSPAAADYLAAMHRELSPDGHLLLLMGGVDGRPGVMGLYTGCGGVLKARLVGLDRSSEAARYDAVAAVDWTALLWAKRAGYRWFDFAGISSASLRVLDAVDGAADRQLIAGPDRYKLRFGATVHRYPQPVELIPSSIIRLGYDLSRRSAVGRQLRARARNMARAGSWRSPRAAALEGAERGS